MTRIIDPLEQFFDDAGNPLIDGLFYFYETGTNTLLDTFSDINLTTPNANPLPLTAAGRCPNAYGYNRLYRVVVKTSDGTQILQRDNVGAFSAEGALESWIYDKTYTKSELVTYNFKFYRSNVDGNIGNFPNSTSQWSEIDFPEKYSSTVTYDLGKLVYENNILYVSAQAANAGNAPTTAHAWWQRVNNIPHWGSASTYRLYDLAIDSAGVMQVSQQNGNLNHNPVTDTAYVWWKPQSRIDLEANQQLTQVKYLSGGGTLSAEWDNWITDSSSYAVPAANTVAANTALLVTKPDKYRTNTPTITPSGGDYFEWSGANDFAGIQLLTSKIEVLKFISNGSNGWRIG